MPKKLNLDPNGANGGLRVARSAKESCSMCKYLRARVSNDYPTLDSGGILCACKQGHKIGVRFTEVPLPTTVKRTCNDFSYVKRTLSEIRNDTYNQIHLWE